MFSPEPSFDAPAAAEARRAIAAQTHQLIAGGRGHNVQGALMPQAWSDSPGAARAKCSCGLLSPELRAHEDRLVWFERHLRVASLVDYDDF